MSTNTHLVVAVLASLLTIFSGEMLMARRFYHVALEKNTAAADLEDKCADKARNESQMKKRQTELLEIQGEIDQRHHRRICYASEVDATVDRVKDELRKIAKNVRFSQHAPNRASDDRDVPHYAMPLTLGVTSRWGEVFQLIAESESLPDLVRVRALELRCDITEVVPHPLVDAKVDLEVIYNLDQPVRGGRDRRGKR